MDDDTFLRAIAAINEDRKWRIDNHLSHVGLLSLYFNSMALLTLCPLACFLWARLLAENDRRLCHLIHSERKVPRKRRPTIVA
jgi:hypothetical protein